MKMGNCRDGSIQSKEQMIEACKLLELRLVELDYSRQVESPGAKTASISIRDGMYMC